MECANGRFKIQNEKSNNRIYKPRNFHIPVYLDREYMRSYTQTDILADNSEDIILPENMNFIEIILCILKLFLYLGEILNLTKSHLINNM